MQQNLVIVDDDEVDRYLVTRIASKSKLDFRIWEFASGQALVDAIGNPSSDLVESLSDRVRALVLADINMPGMNGFEMVDEIRKAILTGKVAEDSLAIMICSSSEHPQDRAAAKKDPLIRGYVVKPPTADRLEELVTMYCLGSEE